MRIVEDEDHVMIAFCSSQNNVLQVRLSLHHLYHQHVDEWFSFHTYLLSYSCEPFTFFSFFFF